MERGFGGRALQAMGYCALALGLAGCGGGGGADSGGTTASTPIEAAAVMAVQAYEQPATAVQQVAGEVKTRAASLGALHAARVALGPISQAKLLAAAPLVGARQIGESRSVDSTATAQSLGRLLQWSTTAQGGLKAAVSITAQGAHGMRLGVLVDQLPESAVLRIYRQDRATAVYEIPAVAVLQAIARNQQAGDTSEAARLWWTPDAGGDETTLEIELPPGVAASAVQVAVPQISHFFADLSLPTQEEFALQTKINESSNCNLDAACHDGYASQRNAVARMIFTSAGQSYVCTGTLLNDRDASGTPYFISANHCVSSQTVASTLQTDWFYRSPSCDSRSLSASTVKRRGGATLLYASASTDTTFLRLNDTPPPGAVFAAWDANPQASNSSVVGLHHPQGDLLKISFGAITGQTACASVSSNQFSCSGSSGNFYRVSWSQGLTEGGSSGSGIFRGNALVGTLYGGASSCSSAADFYGRFDVAYGAALKTWLSPGSSSTPSPTAPTPTVPTSSGALLNWFGQLQGLQPVGPASALR
ncbi:MAG: serine protease [Comamonadaceae bacterium]|nr:MAG: serine protease [Comamonadaceae bacterium]